MNFQDSTNLLFELAHFNAMYPNFVPNYQQMLNPQMVYSENVNQTEKET